MPLDAIDLDRSLVRDHGLRAFVELAWRHADFTDYQHSQHITTMCKRLEHVTEERRAGRPTDTAFALPFGASKSMVVSVLWQAWVWGPFGWPESVWATSANDDSLAYKFSQKAMELVAGDWFQRRWPIKLTKRSSRLWANARGGSRIAVGVGSRITGDHAHFLLLDDPVKEQLTRIGTPYQIAQAVKKATSYWFGTMPSRAKDYTAGSVLIHQRLHIDDPIGVAIREHGYYGVVLPAHCPSRGQEPPGYQRELDPRQPGELLCDRLSESKLRAITYKMGATAAAAQAEQNPMPLGGQVLKAAFMLNRWRTLPSALLRDIEAGRSSPECTWVIAGDMNFKSVRQSLKKTGPDYVVFQIWCALGHRRYLVDEVRGQWGYSEAKLQLALFALRHHHCDTIILEDAANAPALEDDLYEIGLDGFLREALLKHDSSITIPMGWNPQVYLESHGGGALARTQSVLGPWENDHVILPADAPWVDCLNGFVDEHTRFSGDDTTTDDRVACSSLALVYLRDSGLPPWAR